MTPSVIIPKENKNMKADRLLSALMLLAFFRASAQVSMELSLDQDEFLPNEPIRLAVKITNTSGQQLHLGADPSWLTFNVESADGFVIIKKGEVPVVEVRQGSELHALGGRCSHMDGPLWESDLVAGCLECPWHGSIFRVTDGAVARGPATAPQPVFETRVRDGVIQVLLPGAG